MPAVIRGGRRQAAPAAKRRAAAPRGQGRAPQAPQGVFDQGLTPGMAWAGSALAVWASTTVSTSPVSVGEE